MNFESDGSKKLLCVGLIDEEDDVDLIIMVKAFNELPVTLFLHNLELIDLCFLLEY